MELTFEITLSSLVLGGVSVALGLVVLLISWVHTIGIQKYSTILDSIADTPVAKSMYYRMAKKFCSGLKQDELRRGYVVPMASLFLTIVACGLVSYFGAEWQTFLEQKNYVLGGVYVAQNSGAAG